MNSVPPETTAQLEYCLSWLRRRLGDHWIMGAPLGLGKPNHLVNAIYRYACADPSLRLEIFTALSLNPPKPASGLKQRFLQPFMQRQFGDYPRLEYLADLDRKAVPGNISINEFYFRSGTRLRDAHAQRHYLSSNYTHVARDMAARGVNLLVQMVATDAGRPDHFSLSCNPDVSLELLRRVPRQNLAYVVQVNEDLPYMGGHAEIRRDETDLVLFDQPQRLFAVPRMPVAGADQMIGLHVSQLIADGGTLQLGIGSLGDAVSYFTCLRHENNAAYQQLLRDVNADQRVRPNLREAIGGTLPFERGLYAASEMFMEGFLHLYQAGVLKRKVYDDAALQHLLNQGLLGEKLASDTLEVLWQQGWLPRHLNTADVQRMTRLGVLQPGVECDQNLIRLADGGRIENDLGEAANRHQLAQRALGKCLEGGALMHAAFFLGSQWMYDTLNGMSQQQRDLFQMTGVARVNQLYHGEAMDRAQRPHGRFINTTMKLTLLGAAASDQLENGQVVSGVGGQYNFVAMAHALDHARSILMLRSHRLSGGRAVSNIVWQFPHATIPRHLRDLVVTEYGMADLRSASDEEVIQRVLCITDSRWQESLRQQAVEHGKLHPAWEIPPAFRNNSPQWIEQSLQAGYLSGAVSDFPFGSDFTPEELQLTQALRYLASHGLTHFSRAGLVLAALGRGGRYAGKWQPALDRMGLVKPRTLRERLDQRLICLGLHSTQSASAAKKH